MQNAKKEFKKIQVDYSNIYFDFSYNNIVARLRIYFDDVSRKNAANKDRRALNLYLEKMPGNGTYSNSVEVCHFTDLLLFAERKTQWLLEMAFQEFEKQERDALLERMKAPKFIDLESVRSDQYQANIDREGEWPETCLLCGHRLKPNTTLWLHLKTDGNLVPMNIAKLPESEDQGFFPVGADCAKKVHENFVHIR